MKSDSQRVPTCVTRPAKRPWTTTMTTRRGEDGQSQNYRRGHEGRPRNGAVSSHGCVCHVITVVTLHHSESFQHRKKKKKKDLG